MSHVFISYSKKNHAYARKLADYLLEQGFDVWIDEEEIAYNGQWKPATKQALHRCAAVISIMSPEAETSPQVRQEIHLAERLEKPFFPLQLAGEVWETWQDYLVDDVRGGQMPGRDFLDDLAEFAQRRVSTEPPDGAQPPTEPASSSARLTLLHVLEGHDAAVNGVAPLPNGGAISASADRTLQVWNIEGEENVYVARGPVLRGHDSAVNSVAALGNGRVISASVDRTLRAWDIERGKSVRRIKGHKGWVWDVAALEDGRAISASSDETLRVWDVERGKCLQVLEGHSDWVLAVIALPNGHVVSASSDETVRVWEVSSGETLRVLEGHSHPVFDVAALGNRRLVSASDDETLRVWDLRNGQCLRVLAGHSSYVRSVAALGDGRIASASHDGTLRVWDAETGEPLAIYNAETPLFCCAALPDGRTIVAGDQDGKVHFLRYEA